MREAVLLWSLRNTRQIMSLDKTFYFFMAGVGIFTGLVLVRSPEAATLAIKPYFWILIAVAAFDLVSFLRGAAKTGGMLNLNQRMLGFAIGLIWMLLIPYVAGTSIKYF
jgi:hypothetical protein